MADQKISQLTPGGAAQAADEIPIARSGGNVKVTGANIAAAATSVGTLNSLTVSGNLTVNTNTFFVDSTNNRIGIATAAPSVRVHARLGSAVGGGFTGYASGMILESSATANSNIDFVTDRTSTSSISFTDQDAAARGIVEYAHGPDTFRLASAAIMRFDTGGSERMRLDATGALLVNATSSLDSRFRVGGVHPSTANVQYGTIQSPTFNTSSTGGSFVDYVQLISAAGTYTTTNASAYWAAGPNLGAGHTVSNLHGFYYGGHTGSNVTNNYGIYIANISGGTTNFAIYTLAGKNRFGDVVIGVNGTAGAPTYAASADEDTGAFFPAANTYGISTGGSERLRVDSAGQLGLGVTPSVWTNNYRVFEFQAGWVGANDSTTAFVGQNNFVTGGNWAYKNNGAATQYRQAAGVHSWHIAPSGTAGNAITFTQAMTLDANGDLAVGSATVVRVNSDRTIYVQGTSASSINLACGGAFSGAGITLTSGEQLQLRNNGVNRWYINSSGHFLAGADNTYDIGASGATRPRDLYLAGNMVGGGWVRAGAASAGAASTTTIGNTTATTVGAAGGASALPATPLGYIIAHVGTTQVKIPYYNA